LVLGKVLGRVSVTTFFGLFSNADGGMLSVVTGASDGIGAEFAVQLAKAGFNIILVGRDEQKLSDIQNKIASSVCYCDILGPQWRTDSVDVFIGPRLANVHTKIHLIDFSAIDKEGYEQLASLCRDLDVGVLGE
jgi:17beta-estradiol 17-dehydrogenase / very-long-chain 3-oxoacyl-CoA reductase